MRKVFCSLCIIQKISILGDRSLHIISFSVQVEHIWNTKKRIWLFLIILATLSIDFSKQGEVRIFSAFLQKKSVIFWKVSTPILSILPYEWKLSCSEKYNYMGFWKSKLVIKWSKTHPAVGLHVFLLGAKFALKPELLRHDKKNFQGAIFNFNQNPYIQMFVPLIP